MNSEKTESVIDLFCGAGGLGTGFSRYFPITEAIDMNPDCCRTYSFNHAYTRVAERDIRNVDFGRQDFQGILGMTGGPPCQDYSRLNDTRDTNSERANLLFEMTRIILQVRPTWALIENVSSVPKKRKEQVTRTLSDAGYHVVSRVIFANQFGSVQKRHRWMVTAHLDRPVYPESRNTSRVAGEILTGQPSDIHPKPRTLAALKTLPSGHWVAIPGQTFKVYYVIDPRLPLPAIVNPTKLRYVRPDRTGYLSRQELEAAQGFPRTYRIFGNKDAWGKQLANAVPVEMAEAFAESFKKIELN